MSAATATRLVIEAHQDGADFYCVVTGNHIHRSPIRVGDFDTEAATRARAEFVAAMNAQGYAVEFPEVGT